MSRYRPLVYGREPAFCVTLIARPKQHDLIIAPRQHIADDNVCELRFEVIAIPDGVEADFEIGDYLVVQSMEFNKPNMAWPEMPNGEERITSSKYCVAVDTEPDQYKPKSELAV